MNQQILSLILTTNLSFTINIQNSDYDNIIPNFNCMTGQERLDALMNYIIKNCNKYNNLDQRNQYISIILDLVKITLEQKLDKRSGDLILIKSCNFIDINN